MDTSRRRFLQQTVTFAGAAAVAGCSRFTSGPAAQSASSLTKFRVLSIGVIGTIGGHDRKTIALTCPHGSYQSLCP